MEGGKGQGLLIQGGRVVINSKLLLMKLGNLSQSLSTMKAMAEMKSELYTKVKLEQLYKVKNMKMKANSEYHNKSTQFKGTIPKPAQQEFGKIRKIARRVSVIKYIFM